MLFIGKLPALSCLLNLLNRLVFWCLELKHWSILFDEYFYKDLFIYIKVELQRKGNSICKSIVQMALMAGAGLGQNQNPRIVCGAPRRAGARGLRAISRAFRGVLAGGWIRSWRARTWAIAHTECWCWWQPFNPLNHNSSPLVNTNLITWSLTEKLMQNRSFDKLVLDSWPWEFC